MEYWKTHKVIMMTMPVITGSKCTERTFKGEDDDGSKMFIMMVIMR